MINDNDLLVQLQNIFAQVFNNTQLKILPTTTADDIDAWDSLNHAILIDTIEKHFQIKFDLMDMLNMRDVAAICERISEKKLA